MNDSVLVLLRDLVAIDSVNPTLVPGAAGEQAISERIATEMRSVGLDVDVTEVAPGRPNVVGVVEGRGTGRALMLCGHMDTVGVAGMSAPFLPVERNGRLYGRGAQDMKSGVAAMVGVAAEMTARGLSSGRLIVAVVVDEEYASIGADALVNGWSADGALITEPTDLGIATSHKGFAWVEVETRGRAAHGSRPLEGRDAILDMGRVLVRLDELDRELQERSARPFLGTPSLHASTVAGGREFSVYPDRCSLKVERRTVMGEPDAVALAEVEAILDDLRCDDPSFQASARLVFERPPYEISTAHELPRTLATTLTRAGRPAEVVGMSFWTDAAILGRAGIPSVLYGPTGRGLHGLDEYVEIDSVFACRDALTDFARAYCTNL